MDAYNAEIEVINRENFKRFNRLKINYPIQGIISFPVNKISLIIQCGF